jgi:hypothetical protein
VKIGTITVPGSVTPNNLDRKCKLNNDEKAIKMRINLIRSYTMHISHLRNEIKKIGTKIG